MATAYTALLKYNGLKLMNDANVKTMKTQLYKRGFLSSQQLTSIFDLVTEKTVKNFQLAVGILPDGIVGPDTWKYLFASNEVYSDTNTHFNDDQGTLESTVYMASPTVGKVIPIHNYTENNAEAPYFNSNNVDDLRKADLELKINFGINSPMNETIKHIFLRSSSVEVDGSGMPIFKVYEFVGQDIIQN